MFIRQLLASFTTIFLSSVLSGVCRSAVAETYCPAVSSNSPTLSTDRRQNKTSLRIVQYNTEWLFLDYYASSDCPGQGCSWHNQSAATTHMEYVGRIVQELNPDIINICEVEGCDELNALINAMVPNAMEPNVVEPNVVEPSSTTTSAYRSYMVQGKDTSTGQNVGMLTKIDPLVNLYRTEERVAYPVPGSKCASTSSSAVTSTDTTTGVSKHYITEFMFGDLHVAMIGVHLLAFPTDPTRCQEREAQAQVIQNVIAKYASLDYEIIVLGDFNDFDAEVLDSNKNQPTSLVLDIFKGLAGNMAGTYELTNVAEDIVQEDRFSDWWDQNDNCVSGPNEFSMIDHILVSKSIQEYVSAVFIYHGYSEFCDTYNSDHYPVVLDLSM